MSAPESGSVLGVDVGWSAAKTTTGTAVIRWSPSEIRLELARMRCQGAAFREALHAVRKGARFDAAAVDGPLRSGFSELSTYRAAEQALTRGFGRTGIGKPGQASSGNGKKLNLAASAVAHALRDEGAVAPAGHRARIDTLAIVEAFPTSFLGVMLDRDGVPADGAKSDAFFEHLLGPDSPRPRLPTENRLSLLIPRLLPGRTLQHGLAAIVDHEERAALVCAVTALCVVSRQYVAVGDPELGFITLPPLATSAATGLQPWAWDIIRTNLPDGGQGQIVVEPEPDPT